MKYLVFLLLLASALALFNPVNEEIIEKINLQATTWKPARLEDNPLAKKDTFEILKLTLF